MVAGVYLVHPGQFLV